MNNDASGPRPTTSVGIKLIWRLRTNICTARTTNRSAPMPTSTKIKSATKTLRAYENAASPTNAQTVAVVKLLCRVAIRLIRDQYGR